MSAAVTLPPPLSSGSVDIEFQTFPALLLVLNFLLNFITSNEGVPTFYWLRNFEIFNGGIAHREKEGERNGKRKKLFSFFNVDTFFGVETTYDTCTMYRKKSSLNLTIRHLKYLKSYIS